jgi:ribonuclease HI
MRVLQHNCRLSGENVRMAFKSATDLKCELVLIQEPPVGKGAEMMGDPGFRIHKSGKVWTAWSVTSTATWDVRTDIPGGAKEDVHIVTRKRRNQVWRFVNVYEDRRKNPTTMGGLDWTQVITRKTIVAGDMNAHHPEWNTAGRTTRRNAGAVLSLIEDYGMAIANTTEATRYPDGERGSPSNLDLQLTTGDIEVTNWAVTEEETVSDHAVIIFDIGPEEESRKERPTSTGWRFEPLTKEQKERARKRWEEHTARGRAILGPESSSHDVEEEARWIQDALSEAMDQLFKRKRTCARSKPWWTPNIAERRRIASSIRRAYRNGTATREDKLREEKALHKEIRKAKSEHWNEFLQQADETNLWIAAGYRKRGPTGPTPALVDEEGHTATTREEKEEMLRKQAFPPRNTGAEEPLGEEEEATPTMWERITEDEVHEAIHNQSTTKSPGPDRLSFKAIRILWEWEPERVTALVRAAVRTGTQPTAWKNTRAVVIPKPGKPDYRKAKAYRVIALLNCLGKVVEKVVATRISNFVEERGIMHPGQFGSRQRHSSIDAVACLTQWTHEAWREGQILGTLMMDVKGAFDHVHRGLLLRRMKDMGIHRELRAWTESFLTNRRASLVLDGLEGEARAVETGVPQGSPVSPILFAIYLSPLFTHVEDQCPTAGLSFVDDVCWTVRGRDVGEVTTKLEAAAKAAATWAKDNHVEFDIAKTEAVLFTRRRNDRLPRLAQRIKVGRHEVRYNKDATRWLGIWLDSQLTFAEHHNVMMRKARGAQRELRRLSTQRGLTAGNVRKVQVACIQAVALYGSEVWWKGQRNRLEDLQKMVNQQAREITGCLRTTPIGPLVKEAGLRPAISLVENRQRRYGTRILTLPKGHLARSILPAGARGEDIDSTERWEMPGTRNETLGEQLTWMAGGNGVIGQGVGIEPAAIYEREENGADIRIADDEEQAVREEEEWGRDEEAMRIWSDGSRDQTGRAGTGIAWKAENGEWKERRIHLGQNKEVYDAELYGIAEAVSIAHRIVKKTGHTRIAVFSDAQAALKRIKDNSTGPGQWLALRTIERVKRARGDGVNVTIQWIPGHKGVEGNERADQAAKKAATDPRTPRLPANEQFTSAAHLNRRITEEKHQQAWEWAQEKCKGRAMYKLTRTRGIDPKAAEAPKTVSARYFQLKTNHGLVGDHLVRIKKKRADWCWWCAGGGRRPKRQTRHHLFFECRRWTEERAKMFEGMKGGRKRWATAQVSAVMAERKNTKAVLRFIEDTEVGRMLAQDRMEEIEEERRATWGWTEEVREETPDQNPAEPEPGGSGEE